MKHSRVTAAAAVLAAVAAAVGCPASAVAGTSRHRPVAFQRTATYPVFQNRPAGDSASAGTSAEISTVSEDGRTLIYTDSGQQRKPHRAPRRDRSGDQGTGT